MNIKEVTRMTKAYRNIWPRKALSKYLTYASARFLFRLFALLLFRYHCQGRHHIPRRGGALVCANHQSMLDPPIVGMAAGRHLAYLARKTLFKHPLLGWFLRKVDGIPLDQSGMGIQGIKATLKSLKTGDVVVIFPEGTRSKTGELQQLKGGFIALARRAKVPLVPCGSIGAHECLPRGTGGLRFRRIRCVYGEAISVSEIESLSDEQLLATVHSRILDCMHRAKISRN
jgi:1-acyl-sn-glycerol-3-phosphate acyltransferase